MRPFLPFGLVLVLSLPALAAEPEITIDLRGQAIKGSELPAVVIRIDSENASLVWTDDKLKEHAFSVEVMANHPGPRPWSTHLAWLIARSKDDFWIMWAYFNETGRRAWINYYHFAENLARMTNFAGSYTYRPPETFTNAPFDIDVPIERAPEYRGVAFSHRDFTAKGGRFRKLTYRDGADWKVRGEELTVKPLIHLVVPPANGWDEPGWTEVHCLARSDDGTRLYYVVTYTAVDHGWVVDLKDGKVLKVHFGTRVSLESD